MRSIRAKSALAASLALLTAYFVVTRLLIYWRPSRALSSALLDFLHPGLLKYPFHWISVETGILLAGTAGLYLFGLAVSEGAPLARLRHVPALMKRGVWKPLIWAYLFGSFVWSILGVIYFVNVYGSFAQGGSWLSQLVSALGYVSPLAGFYCAGRLLFGRNRWWPDKWIGYIGAAAALFGVSWRTITMMGLGKYASILGVFGSHGLSNPFGTVTYVAIGCAAAWTDLTLARRGGAAMLGRRDPSGTIYLILGGSVLSGLVSKATALGYLLPVLPIPYSIAYLGMLAGCICVVLLCFIDGGSVFVVPDNESPVAAAKPARVAMFHQIVDSISSARFWADLALSFVITLVLLGIASAAFGGIPLVAAAFILPIIIFGFLVGPIAMFIIGVLRGRPGFAAAPVLILLAAFSYRQASLVAAAHHAEGAVEKAAELNVYPFAEPSQKHDVVVIEGAYDDPDGRCQSDCQQILLSSSYAVAFAEKKSGQWRIYRLAAGDGLCRQPEQVKSYLEMIASRRLGTCITMSREAPQQNGLVIREDYSIESPVKKLLPKGVRASITDFYERIDGKDQLLGRIVSGNVKPPLLSSQKPAKTPIQMSGAAFFAAALKLPITDRPPRGDADPAKVLAAFESLFGDPTVGRDAREYFHQFGGQTEAEVAPKRAAILRFWQSNDPQLIKLGLSSLYSIKNLGLDFAKPVVAQFLASSDPVVMKAAVSSLYAFDKDLEFAKPALADLILSDRIAAYHDDDLRSVTKMLKSVPGSFASEIRIRAKAQLDSRSDLEDGRLLAVLALVARGDQQTRQEAVDWIFARQGEGFERVMTAIWAGYDALGAPMSVQFWSKEEIERLIARAPTVSDQGLIGYVRALEFQVNGREFRPKLKEILEARAETLDDGSSEDKKLAKDMLYAAKSIRQ